MNCKMIQSFSLIPGAWDKTFKRTVTSSGAERIKTLKEREITLKRDLEREVEQWV